MPETFAGSSQTDVVMPQPSESMPNRRVSESPEPDPANAHRQPVFGKPIRRLQNPAEQLPSEVANPDLASVPVDEPDGCRH